MRDVQPTAASQLSKYNSIVISAIYMILLAQLNIFVLGKQLESIDT